MIKFPFFNAQEMNLDWILQTLKRILNFMPIYSGHVGDVLQRKIDGAAWEPISAVSMDIDGLTYEPTPDAADEIPFYDVSVPGNRKTTVADLVSGVAPVTSVNGQTGAVTLTKSDVGLGNVDNVQQYSSSNPPPYPVTSVNSQTGAVSLSFTKSDVGLGNVANVLQYSASNPPPYPVTSVNGQTGAVTVSGGSSLLLSSPAMLSFGAPTGVTIQWGSVYGKKTADNNVFCMYGNFLFTTTVTGELTFTVAGLSVTSPASMVTMNNTGISFRIPGGTDPDIPIYRPSSDDNMHISVDIAGNITFTVWAQYAGAYEVILQPFLIPLA